MKLAKILPLCFINILLISLPVFSMDQAMDQEAGDLSLFLKKTDSFSTFAESLDKLIARIQISQNPTEQDSEGKTVLHHLAAYGKSAPLIAWFNLWSSQLNPQGTEILFISAIEPFLNVQDKYLNTPLDVAKQNNKFVVFTLLQCWGASTKEALAQDQNT